ncbi:DNA-binding transcriptional response regulator, NtrC family, contains REC, AAA-type ATPase, and a Fis-type DNA-binding domains [Ectothiorhodospira magna]|uniref:DNA-binding transcriptional response regulator, NtrC family, contains REC, AAA-type ATPase, and a Fis-type DNA-binding domains n=1 Tax=Ectothiorhodospira magna TaxID=867345 RepID=A0A1H9FTN0_9GAMM|nr:sigma-54 dependent transcriptional regulator [Ectothiorhodospira magna]SEQ40863.1 DNA-binding transcriptional response regulator, NtrC family, contains REC, AAA-type ATPase, and a Fis-type DNA-binding domains [Ectothiorhodospira magna]
MNRILILEDEAVIRRALRRLLEHEGYRIDEAACIAQARQCCRDTPPDLLICDLRLPDGEGIEMLGHCGDAPVLIMTSYASVRSAVEAMKQGAADYIAKPFDHDEMLLCVARLLKQQQLTGEQAQSRPEPTGAMTDMVGDSPAMQQICRTLEKVSPTDATVLIRGESGTGKELVARAIHRQSRRAQAPLISVNCAAIPEGLLESELFGHEKGAFTGAAQRRQGLAEAANGGTLFLDEIGELTPAAQSRLLRVLQDGEIRRVGANSSHKVDLRLLAATHRDLEQMVREGHFREDLYYRLKVMEITLPPLRDRLEDLPQLASFLLDKACQRLRQTPVTLAPAALAALQAHRWPGNVRELENALERAVILADGDTIAAEHLGLTPGPTQDMAPDTSLEDYFRRFVLENQARMTETELARRLGISRKALWERRQRMGIPRPRA